MQWWFKNVQEMRALRMRSTAASHWKLTATWQIDEELNVDHSMVIWHLKLVKWIPCELHRNKKIPSFRSVIFSYSTQQEWTISQLDCDRWQKVDFIRTTAITSSVVGPRRSSKALQKARLVQENSRSLSGGVLPVRSTTAFWILVKLLHLRSMLSKLMRCRWKPQFFNRIGPILHNNARPQVTQPFLKMNDAPQISLKFYLQ